MNPLNRSPSTGRLNPLPESGLVFLGLLFFVAILGAGLAVLHRVPSMAAKREKEAELLFIGKQYQQALASYNQASPGTAKRYPVSLDQLLIDNRFPHVVRHLRRIWRDPITGSSLWGVERDESGGIAGVYSLSEDQPIKKANFGPGKEHFTDATSYRMWVFRAVLAIQPSDKPPQSPDPVAEVLR
ncbi:MAG TPA: type II secretion system protein [Thiobacillaceae bacterium]|nr:type II secretion system protein [Thiobacillaceae bacterium]